MATLNPAMNDASRSAQPATGCVAITGSAQVLATTGRGLFITTQGDITFTMQDGSTMTLTALPVGVYSFTVRAITTGATAAGWVLI
jgi:hypothetical protein